MCVLTAAAGACLRILEVPSIHVCFHDAEQYQWNAHAPADSPFTYLAKKKITFYLQTTTLYTKNWVE